MLRRALGRAAGAAGILVCLVASSCSTTANVTDVITALDPEGNRPRNVFFTDTKEIHCLFQAGVGRRGLTLEVTVRQIVNYDFVRREFYEVDRVYGYAEFSPDPSTTNQTLGIPVVPVNPITGEPDEEQPYLPGRYQCEVRMDGELKGVAVYNVEFPPCPISYIFNRSPCYGFYEEGTQCPLYGITSRDPDACTCEVQGWNCPVAVP